MQTVLLLLLFNNNYYYYHHHPLTSGLKKNAWLRAWPERPKLQFLVGKVKL